MGAKWNTEMGYAMFLEGKSNRQIAQAVGANENTIGSYRRQHWAENSKDEAEAADDGPKTKEERELTELLRLLRDAEQGKIWYHTAELRIRAACGAAARLLEGGRVLELLDRAEERSQREKMMESLRREAVKEERAEPVKKQEDRKQIYARAYSAGWRACERCWKDSESE